LNTDHIDLYLLHWRGEIPLAETLEAFEQLVKSGKIRAWGVSNFDLSDLQELMQLSGGKEIAANQVLYNMQRRGIEYDLLPWCRKHHIPVMAYSPIEQGRLLANPAVAALAARREVSIAQIALAWILRQPNVIPIPKAGSCDHVRENRAALDLQLSPEELSELDQAFPPPTSAQPLETI
jgi:diketogulonate reductase-like aldo/keto reductase